MLIERLSRTLKAESFTTVIAQDGELAVTKALNQSFDAIILDLMLPKKNGFEVIQAIRAHSDVPIIVFSDRTEDIDRIVALELGADKYLTKPCHPLEFIAELHAILRRTKTKPASRHVIQYHHITVDGIKREAFVSGVLLDLTHTEFNILDMLIKSPGQAFSKEELTEYALGRPFTAYDRSIDVHISNLRSKLGDHESPDPLIKTIRGFGYMLTNLEISAIIYNGTDKTRS